MTGVKSEINRYLAAIWAIGRTAHVILEENFESREAEYVFEDSRLKEKCYGHMDIVYRNEPIDFKSSRITIKTFKDLPQKWIDQVVYECVFVDSQIGWLAVLDLVNTVVTVWKIQVTLQEVVNARTKYVEIMSQIQNAVESKNPYGLIPVRKECLRCVYTKGCLRRPGI